MTRFRWQPFALFGAVVIAFVVFLATRHHDAGPAPASAPITEPDEIDLNAELQQIADQANSGDLDGAHDRLDELEHQVGPNPAIRDLRHQLDKARKHGRGKHGED